MKIFGFQVGRSGKGPVKKSTFSNIASFFSTTGGYPDPKADEQLKAYSKNEWVFSAVDSRANAIAGATLKLKMKKKDGTAEDYEKEHEAMSVLQRPNDVMTKSDLFKILSIHLDTVGRGFWKIQPGKGKNKGQKTLRPLDPTKIEIVPDEEQIISGYRYTKANGQKDVLTKSEVIFFRRINPEVFYDGISPLKACSATFDSDVYAALWNLNFFKNSGRPGAVLKVKGKLTDKQRERIEKMWKDKFQGVDNAHRLAILENEAEIGDDTSTHREMEFTELGEKAKERILGAYRVPAAMIGQSKDFNRANIYGIEYIFAKYTTWPQLQMIAEYLTQFYLPMFEGTDNLFFEFDNPTPQDKELQLKEQKTDFETGAVTPNEIREKKGREPVENGDQAYVPASAVPVSEDTQEEDPQDDPEDDDKKEKKGIKKKAKISRRILLQAWLRRFSRSEKRVAKKIKKLFEAQEKDVLAKLRKRKKDLTDDIIDEDKWKEKFIKVGVPIFREIFKVEGQTAIDEMGLEATFQTDDPKVRLQLARQAAKFADDVNSTTVERIRKVLQDGVAQGEGEKRLAGRVKEVFSVAKNHRARTIARTEVLKAANYGHFQAYEQVGVKKKEWIDAHDNRVRDTHTKANGQIRLLNKPFSVGGAYLMYPGDPSGPPKEIINCRCRMAPILE